MSNNIIFPSNNSPYTYIYDHYKNVTEDELKRIVMLKQSKFLDELKEKHGNQDLPRHIAKTIINCIASYLGVERGKQKTVIPKKTKKSKQTESTPSAEQLTTIKEEDKSEEKDIIFLDKESAEKVNSVDAEIDKLKEKIELLEREKERLNEKIKQYEKEINPPNTVNKELLIQEVYSSLYMSSVETINVKINRPLLSELMKYFNENHPSFILNSSLNFTDIYSSAVNCSLQVFLKDNRL